MTLLRGWPKRRNMRKWKQVHKRGRQDRWTGNSNNCPWNWGLLDWACSWLTRQGKVGVRYDWELQQWGDCHSSVPSPHSQRRECGKVIRKRVRIQGTLALYHSPPLALTQYRWWSWDLSHSIWTPGPKYIEAFFDPLTCWAFELCEPFVGHPAVFLDDCLNLPFCGENKNECHSGGIPKRKGCA